MKAEAARAAKSGLPATGLLNTSSGPRDARQRNGRGLKVRLRGLNDVWLSQTSNNKDAKLLGCWGDPILIAKDGKKVRLTDLEPVITGGTVQVTPQAPAGKSKRKPRGPRIGRQQLTYGLLVKPGVELRYKLDGKYEWLQASVGVAAAGNNRHTIEFRVTSVPPKEAIQRERDRATILKLVQRDFTSASDIRQIGREMELRVWDADWTPGRYADVARRYVGQVKFAHLAEQAKAIASNKSATPADVVKIATLLHRSADATSNLAEAQRVDLAALRRAVEDLTKTFGDEYPKGKEYLARIAAAEKAGAAVFANAGKSTADFDKAAKLAEGLVSLRQDALLSNPLLNFDKLLMIKRGNRSPKMGLPQNWVGNCSLPRSGFDDEIVTLSPVRPGGRLTRVYKPEKNVMVGDVDLHFDADRMLFSSIGENGRWQVFEVKTDGTGLRQVTKGPIADADNYDACYLPNGRIIFDSSAVMQGVPCVGGKSPVANLYVMDADGSNVRQLCFDQDHNWCPTVMNDGRVMYTRWEYTDSPHYFTRLVFHMNPDGTQQMALYGSNSFWPNSTYYARPIPGTSSKFVAVISGHHGDARMGELLVFDTKEGRHEAEGAVQRIPGHGKQVAPVIADRLVGGSWPKFLHPWPLSDKYFLVACKLNGSAPWDVCLVDVFDNILPLCSVPGYGMLEPVPLRKTKTPPVIPDKVDLKRKDALVYLTDIYAGGGLAGVPRGTVKKLRVFEWHYGYQRVGGHQTVAKEGGWDIKRILGTAPVEPDGSALFRVPANTPLAVQPLDEQGRALQLMRSWFVGMPGEMVSCVGCHEAPEASTANIHTEAIRQDARELEPWYGPARGFSFRREVQPVLDKYCVGCHDGKKPDRPNFADTERGAGGFAKSYLALHPYVRRPGPESDYHMLKPAEYRANTSELIQMLTKGHKNVKLDAEAWDRLVTWIDMNVPDHGSWTEQAGESRAQAQQELRAKYRKLYANIDANPEEIVEVETEPIRFIQPEPFKRPDVVTPKVAGWPFDAATAKKRQTAAGAQAARTVDLGSGVKLELVLVPAGEFVMGDANGDLDEIPLARVKVDKPFWMGRLEVTNLQYKQFDPVHDSRYIDQHWKDHTTPGYPANKPQQPVIRITWNQAMAFCEWLSAKTGQRFTLPTEAEWEWACRAGTATPFSFGDADADYSTFANLGDVSLRLMAVKGVNPKPIGKPDSLEDFIPKDTRFDDKNMIVGEVGKYKPNAWGLCDMHGNVAEWTLSTFKPYPYRDGDGRNKVTADGEKVVRGGSWRDRPKRARSAFRLHYPAWQPVFNVGFRVVCPVGGGKVALTQ
jgi:formylglycine-generating enzyme required for sulfatase activity